MVVFDIRVRVPLRLWSAATGDNADESRAVLDQPPFLNAACRAGTALARCLAEWFAADESASGSSRMRESQVSARSGSGAPTRTTFCPNAAEPNISAPASESAGTTADVFHP